MYTGTSFIFINQVFPLFCMLTVSEFLLDWSYVRLDHCVGFDIIFMLWFC